MPNSWVVRYTSWSSNTAFDERSIITFPAWSTGIEIPNESLDSWTEYTFKTYFTNSAWGQCAWDSTWVNSFETYVIDDSFEQWYQLYSINHTDATCWNSDGTIVISDLYDSWDDYTIIWSNEDQSVTGSNDITTFWNWVNYTIDTLPQGTYTITIDNIDPDFLACESSRTVVVWETGCTWVCNNPDTNFAFNVPDQTSCPEAIPANITIPPSNWLWEYTYTLFSGDNSLWNVVQTIVTWSTSTVFDAVYNWAYDVTISYIEDDLDWWVCTSYLNSLTPVTECEEAVENCPSDLLDIEYIIWDQPTCSEWWSIDFNIDVNNLDNENLVEITSYVIESWNDTQTWLWSNNFEYVFTWLSSWIYTWSVFLDFTNSNGDTNPCYYSASPAVTVQEPNCQWTCPTLDITVDSTAETQCNEGWHATISYTTIDPSSISWGTTTFRLLPDSGNSPLNIYNLAVTSETTQTRNDITSWTYTPTIEFDLTDGTECDYPQTQILLPSACQWTTCPSQQDLTVNTVGATCDTDWQATLWFNQINSWVTWTINILSGSITITSWSLTSNALSLTESLPQWSYTAFISFSNSSNCVDIYQPFTIWWPTQCGATCNTSTWDFQILNSPNTACSSPFNGEITAQWIEIQEQFGFTQIVVTTPWWNTISSTNVTTNSATINELAPWMYGVQVNGTQNGVTCTSIDLWEVTIADQCQQPATCGWVIITWSVLSPTSCHDAWWSIQRDIGIPWSNQLTNYEFLVNDITIQENYSSALLQPWLINSSYTPRVRYSINSVVCDEVIWNTVILPNDESTCLMCPDTLGSYTGPDLVLHNAEWDTTLSTEFANHEYFILHMAHPWCNAVDNNLDWLYEWALDASWRCWYAMLTFDDVFGQEAIQDILYENLNNSDAINYFYNNTYQYSFDSSNSICDWTLIWPPSGYDTCDHSFDRSETVYWELATSFAEAFGISVTELQEPHRYDGINHNDFFWWSSYMLIDREWNVRIIPNKPGMLWFRAVSNLLPFCGSSCEEVPSQLPTYRQSCDETLTCYPDADHDGYIDENSFTVNDSCQCPYWSVSQRWVDGMLAWNDDIYDCNDNDIAISEDFQCTEEWQCEDWIDNDLDGLVDADDIEDCWYLTNWSGWDPSSFFCDYDRDYIFSPGSTCEFNTLWECASLCDDPFFSNEPQNCCVRSLSPTDSEWDNCDTEYNIEQFDSDNDWIWDACDDDDDNDWIADDEDTCGNPTVNCSQDSDNDGIPNSQDNCPDFADPSNSCTNSITNDSDNDWVLDSEDNCPQISNPSQENLDNDSLWDSCDNDRDWDWVKDSNDVCVVLGLVHNSTNTDNDQFWNACDDDDDNDWILDWPDNCELISNTTQSDQDNDWIWDVCDSDYTVDNCEYFVEQFDSTWASIGQGCDSDADQDQVPDSQDNALECYNPADSEWVQEDIDNDWVWNSISSWRYNADDDGITNSCDTDSDWDGFANIIDLCDFVDTTVIVDTDNDGIGDECDPCDTVIWVVCQNDPDQDNDTIPDSTDNCITISNPQQEDTDSDGIGNSCDACPTISWSSCNWTNDTDGDWVANNSDNCPIVSNTNQLDSDNDWIGNVCDDCPTISWTVCNIPSDSDGDGIQNSIDNCPSISNSDQLDSDNDWIGNVCDLVVDDEDNISTTIENSWPNSWDINNDSILDSSQNTVASTINTVTNQYIWLVTNPVSWCIIRQFWSVPESSLSIDDSNREYPLWLATFTLSCWAPWSTATVQIIYPWVHDTSTWSFRKFNTRTNTYITISDIVTYTSIQYAWGSAVIAEYQITDWWPYDNDGLVNWSISDPAWPSIIQNNSTGWGRSSWRASSITEDNIVCGNWYERFWNYCKKLPKVQREYIRTSLEEQRNQTIENIVSSPFAAESLTRITSRLQESIQNINLACEWDPSSWYQRIQRMRDVSREDRTRAPFKLSLYCVTSWYQRGFQDRALTSIWEAIKMVSKAHALVNWNTISMRNQTTWYYDAPASAWYSPYVNYASQQWILTGLTNSHRNQNELKALTPISSSQFDLLLSNAWAKDSTDATSFLDQFTSLLHGSAWWISREEAADQVVDAFPDAFADAELMVWNNIQVYRIILSELQQKSSSRQEQYLRGIIDKFKTSDSSYFSQIWIDIKVIVEVLESGLE
jgi:hypothetical protein